MRHSDNPVRLVDLHAQYAALRGELDDAIREVISRGVFVGGEPVERFGAAFARYTGTSYCIPCANGTDALELALGAYSIGPGDEVIVPAFSFVATLEAVCNVGATPVLCDTERDHYTMDPVQAGALVTSRTKAIIPVHLYGQMADMDALSDLANRHSLRLIEDAAQAHGAAWRGQRAGSIGDAGCFSFYPGKNLGAYGDAGAVLTADPQVADRILRISNHGRLSKYEHDIVGRNSRMDTLQAAILEVKLRHLEDWTARRRRLAEAYTARLSRIDGIGCPVPRPHADPVFHLYVIRVEAGRRDDLQAYLAQEGIETGIHYPAALNRLKVSTDALRLAVNCPVAEQASREVLSLPLYPEMTEDILDRVCHAVENFFRS